MLYGSEYWVIDRRIEQRVRVAEMRILRWINGMTREDRIRNKCVRGSIG